MTHNRFHVTTIIGVMPRNGSNTLIGRRESRDVLALSTVRKRIATLRSWASSTFDGFSDTGDTNLLRIVTASHYVTGVENVTILRIRPVSTQPVGIGSRVTHTGRTGIVRDVAPLHSTGPAVGVRFDDEPDDGWLHWYPVGVFR